MDTAACQACGCAPSVPLCVSQTNTQTSCSNLKRKGGHSSLGFESERPFPGTAGRTGQVNESGSSPRPHHRGAAQRGTSCRGVILRQECNLLRKGKPSPALPIHPESLRGPELRGQLSFRWRDRRGSSLWESRGSFVECPCGPGTVSDGFYGTFSSAATSLTLTLPPVKGTAKGGDPNTPGLAGAAGV